MLFVKTFPVGAFQCNCTILGDPETGDAIVVDPGDEGERIVKEINAKGFKVKYIVHTHAHLDHIGATSFVKQKSGGTIGLHKDDLFLYENMEMQGQMLGLHVDKNVKPIDHFLTQGDILDWGKNQKIEVLHTPGHTPGSLCFLAKGFNNGQDLLFAGDTLFMGSIGRTDLWGGDYGQIIDSIKTKLVTLDETITVVCGHGPNTTVGREKKVNPFIQ
ncbi:MBL fold metallo-hydrolase [bacterium]|nr:MBL fold metallo-hydrolase [bacterium]